MTQVNIKATTLKEVSLAVSVEQKAKGKLKSVADLLYADGVRADMLGKGGYDEVLAVVKGAIVAGFLKSEQVLLTIDIKLVPEHQKSERKTLQQEIGSYVAKIKAHLANLEDTGEKEVTKKTDLQIIHEKLAEVVKKLQKLEGSHKFDIAATITKINAVAKTIPLQ